MNKPLFSIIVPVYNVEDYVENCITNVLSQTQSDYELILIDDGSTDDSGSICDYYRESSHIKIIHKANGGLSSARNAGLDIAQGEYILFIDSDDYWCDSTSLENLAHCIKTNDTPDIILYGCKKVNLLKGTCSIEHCHYDLEILGKSSRQQELQYLYNSHQYPGSAWIICANRSLIERIGLRFPEGVTSEDIGWINALMTEAEHISAINHPFYVYNIGRTGQITGTPSIKSVKGMLMAIDEWLLSSKGKIYPAVTLQMAHVYLVMLMEYARLCKTDRKKLSKLVAKYRCILKHGGTLHQIIYVLNSCISLRLLGLLIYYAFKLKTQLIR